MRDTRGMSIDSESREAVVAHQIATDLAEVVSAGALLVAPYLRKVARSAPEVGLKQDIHDPVTIHDRHVEGMLRAFLGAAVPGSRVLGEEMGEDVSPPEGPEFQECAEAADTLPSSVRERVGGLGNRVRWIVDPIDGTANFASGLTYFGTSIAAELDGAVVAGAISVPFNYELFVADATNAWHFNESTGTRAPLRSEGPTRESEALIATYYPGHYSLTRRPELTLAHERDLMTHYSTVRRPGAGALDLAMVAAGWIGVSMGVRFKPWDVAAGIQMVKVAGGNVLNLKMGTEEPEGLRPGIVASVGTLRATTAERILRELEEALAAEG